MKAFGKSCFVAIVVATSSIGMGCVEAPAVVQGKVLDYQNATKDLVVQDDESPQKVTVSVSGAEIGADPAKGDNVRVAYVPQGQKFVALRVMNITRQAEFKNKGGH